MTQSIESLNHSSAFPGLLVFAEGPGGLPVARITASGGEAMVSLSGGHVMTWNPKGEKPVIWLSGFAKFAPGKSIRGGVPVCWPWFGPHETEAGYPGHGFARALPWLVEKTEILPDEGVRLTLALEQNETARSQWPHSATLQSRITVGRELHMELITRNAGRDSFMIGEALHAYFAVSDIRKSLVRGLDGCAYVDKVDGGRRKIQNGSISIGEEVDRVYLNTEGDCLISDAGLNRSIRIRKQGSLSTVVWNPWAERAESMGDFGPDGYLGMVCVETANALDNRLEIPPGEEHILSATYSVEPLTAD